MARMQGVPFLGITDNGTMSAWDVVCVHTIVGYQANGNAAHFTTGASGKIVQARDTRYRSAANLNGNYRVIAIENEDFGPAYGSWSGSDVPRFTPEQAEAIARIIVWCHQVHGIPIELVQDSKPGRRGVAYHRQGIDGNFLTYAGRVAGGELWSSSRGKVCPGDRRISQLIAEIIPRARVLAGQQQGQQEDVVDQIHEQWLPGKETWGVVAVQPVGASSTLRPGSKAWLHLRVPHLPAKLHGLWAVHYNGTAKELVNAESDLPFDHYNVWELPDGTMQVSAFYTAEVPIGATVELLAS